MTPAAWQERLAPWIGSPVQVKLRGGGEVEGVMSLTEDRVILTIGHGAQARIGFDAIREVWVQLALAEEEE